MLTLDDFLTAKAAANLSPRTIEWYEGQLGPWVAWLDQMGADPLDPATVRAYLAARRQEKGDRAVLPAYRALSAFFRWQVAQDAIGANPLERVARPKAPRRAPRQVSFEHYEALLASIGGDSWIDARDRLIVQLLFLCGIRVGELVGLGVVDIDLQRRLLRVVGKGNRERLVPVWAAIGPPLLEYLMRRPPWPGPELLLSSDGAGGVRGVLTDEGVRQRLRLLCKRAGLPHMNPHAFRHGLAMHLLNGGHADMSLIQRILGHADITTTQRVYAEWLTEGMLSAYDEAMAKAQGRRPNN